MINVALCANELTSTFSRAGFSVPKNFIRLSNGKYLLETVLENNFSKAKGDLIAVVPQYQINSEELLKISNSLEERGLEIKFVGCPQTPSALASLLWAADSFGDHPMRVTPGDCLVTVSETDTRNDVDYMVTAEGHEDRWGFVSMSSDGKIIEFASKNPISSTIFTGEFRLSDSINVVRIATKLLSGQNQVHPHLGEIFLIGARSAQPAQLRAQTFIPLASPGDVRRFERSFA
jgi:hypothetical protein